MRIFVLNLKRAKRIRRILKGKESDYRHVVYIDSIHPKEKQHVKEYPVSVKQYTKAGMKTAVHYIPMKVGTKVLGVCGRQVYKRAKRIAQSF